MTRDPISEAPLQYWSGAYAKATALNASTVAIEQIKALEGLRLTAYEDVGGVRTIGYGHAHGVRAGEVIDEYEAEALLKSDLDTIGNHIAPAITELLRQHEYDALLSFAYNVGSLRFTNSDVLRHVNNRNMQQAGDALLGWCHVKGKVIHGLLQRRKLERRWLTANPLP